MIKVSVVIPIFNAEKYLEQCIRSVMEQTLKDIEIILIDDGSTDGSAEICNKFVSEDKRIIYYYKENEGLAAARQDGIERASGKYVGFVDSDDWVEPDMFEKMYIAGKSNDSDVVLCNAFKYSEEKVSFNICGGAYNRNQIENEVLPKSFITIDERGARSNIRWSNCIRIYKKATIDNNFISFDRRFRRSQDLPFTLDMMLEAENFYYVDEFLYHNRQDAGSLSRGYTKNMWKLVKPLIIHIKDSVSKYPKYEKYYGTTAFFLCTDCIDNEFKSDAPPFYERKKHLKEILSDEVCFSCLGLFDGSKLNSYYRKIYYKNMLKKSALGLLREKWYYTSALQRFVGKILNFLTESKVVGTIYKKIRGKS